VASTDEYQYVHGQHEPSTTLLAPTQRPLALGRSRPRLIGQSGTLKNTEREYVGVGCTHAPGSVGWVLTVRRCLGQRYEQAPHVSLQRRRPSLVSAPPDSASHIPSDFAAARTAPLSLTRAAGCFSGRATRQPRRQTRRSAAPVSRLAGDRMANAIELVDGKVLVPASTPLRRHTPVQAAHLTNQR
jgi:hypothetical protein